MRRLLAMLFVVLCVVLVGWLGTAVLRDAAAQRDALVARGSYPSADLVDLDEHPAEPPRFPDRPALLMFYTTSCEFCRSEIRMLLRAAPSFDGAQITLISPEDTETLREHAAEAGLDVIPVLRMLRDPGAELAARLGIRSVPTVLIYDKNGRLAATFEGLTSVDTLLSHLTPLL